MERGVLVVGESLVDVVRARSGEERAHPGGSAANVAVALARLGRPTCLATSFAADADGELIAAHLAGAGVTLAGDPAAVARTSTAIATIGPSGAADYTFDVEWQLSPLPEELDPLVVYVTSLGPVLPPGAGVVHALLDRVHGRASVVYDVNARPALTGSGPELLARVEWTVSSADLVKASDEDLHVLYPGRPYDDSAAALLALGPAAVVVTRGSDGAVWLDRSGSVEVSSRPVAGADTIGAGDTFGAGLVDALWERGRLGDGRAALTALSRSEVADLLEHAGAAAAVTVSRPGADPPYRHEF
jgi:fructokinase